MNKQELIERIDKLPYVEGPIVDTVTVNRSWILESIEQLDEPQKPVVPQYVADWYEKGKKELSLRDLMSRSCITTEVDDWLGELDEDGDFKNQETFAKAVLYGYTVEKEPKYTVKIKAVDQYLVRNTDEDFLGFLQSRLKSKFTRKELEDAGLGEAFNSPLFEVEEAAE